MNEIWKKSKRFPSYAVSSLGRIKRLTNKKGRKAGSIKAFCINGSGYFQVPLWENGKQTMAYPHHLVAEEFIGSRPFGHDVNHLDRNKHNNKLSNLEYLTHRENCPRGEMAGNSKLKESDINSIKQMHKNGLSQEAIANKYGVVQTTISRIVLGQTWVLA